MKYVLHGKHFVASTATQGAALSDPQLHQSASVADDYISRMQRLMRFMSDTRRKGEASAEAIRCASSTLSALQVEFRGLPIPHASTGEEGRFLLFWDISEHHFELEFFANGSFEAFYENMRTGALWGEDYDNNVTSCLCTNSISFDFSKYSL